MSLYTIQGETLTNIADALRKQQYTNEEFTPEEMAEKIKNTQLGLPIYCDCRVKDHINSTTGEWERPSNWPDIVALADEIEGEEDCLYLTYDSSCHPDYHWIGLKAGINNNSKKWHLDRLEYINDEWTIAEHYELSHAEVFRQNLETNTITLWRITCPESHIGSFGFVTNTSTAANNYYNGCQPCVERAGQLLWCNSIGNSNHATDDSIGGSTKWLERDCAVFGTKANMLYLNNMWSYSYNLYEIDLSKWNTTNWHVRSIQNVFGYCLSLKKLDLHYWDTTNWVVTNINYAFQNCWSLEELDVSTWDTSNWAVARMELAWVRCYNLKALDLNNWNTSNWAVIQMNDIWNSCRNLRSLKIDKWNTSNWAVTNISHAWDHCNSLRELHLNGWDTSNWAITSFTYTWNYCYSLEVLEIDNWKTDNWTVNNLAYVWAECQKLKELRLNKWNTSAWTVTALSSTWAYNHSLRILEIDQWDTSNWTVTSLAYTWYLNTSLTELNINDWNTSNWAVTSLAQAWNSCSSLYNFDIHSWDTTNWKVTNTDSMFTLLFHCKTLLTPASLGISPTQTSSVSATPNGAVRLINYSGYAIYVNHTYAETPNLSITSVKNIINRLPTVSTARTLTLGQINKVKLSQEDIASATQKGWTIA